MGSFRATRTATLVNPLSDVAYASAPAGIAVQFDQGEAPTADYLTVYDGSGNEVPFQWEGATHPRTEADVSTWGDGSLKAGTIWVMVPSLDAGGSATYRLVFSGAAQNHAYSETVAHTVVSGTVERFDTTSQRYSFESGQCWMLRRIYDQGLSGEDYFTGQNGLNVRYDVSGVGEFSSTAADVTLTSKGERNSGAFGAGVVFREWETLWNWNAETNLNSGVRYRVWANGKCDAEHYAYTTGPLASNSHRMQVQCLFQTTNTPVATADIPNGYTSVQWSTPAEKRILFGARVQQVQSEVTTTESYTTAVSFATQPTFGWGPQTTSAASGAYFTQSVFLSPRYTSGDAANENLRLRNRLQTRFTRKTAASLNGDLRSLALQLMQMFDTYYADAGDTSWLGCHAAVKVVLGRETGADNYSAASTLWSSWLSAVGADGSASGYTTLWNGSTGIEYIGRNGHALHELYDEAVRTSRDPSSWATLIHNLADFFVAAESSSGANGSVKLSGSGADNWNAEASALCHLGKSLSITADSTRQATFDRIWSRFSGNFEARNLQAYSISAGGSTLNLSIIQPTSHYFAFQQSEALSAYEKLPGSMSGYALQPRALIMNAITPAGQVKERTTQFNPDRRGAPSTQIMMAAALATAQNANASDLEAAASLLRHLISQTSGAIFPSPVDGWSYSGGIVNSAMDVQALIPLAA